MPASFSAATLIRYKVFGWRPVIVIEFDDVFSIRSLKFQDSSKFFSSIINLFHSLESFHYKCKGKAFR